MKRYGLVNAPVVTVIKLNDPDVHLDDAVRPTRRVSADTAKRLTRPKPDVGCPRLQDICKPVALAASVAAREFVEAFPHESPSDEWIVQTYARDSAGLDWPHEARAHYRMTFHGSVTDARRLAGEQTWAGWRANMDATPPERGER